MNNKSKYCEGCTYYIKYGSDMVNCIPYNKDGSCPCANCIVKMICTYNVCDAWTKWDSPHPRKYQ